MKIGANTLYPQGLLPNASLFDLQAVKGALCKLKDVGYETVEYSHAFYLKREEAGEAGRYARSLGLEGHSLHSEGLPGFRLGSTPQEAQAALGHCVEVGAVLGVHVLVVHAPLMMELELLEGIPLARVMEADLSALDPVRRRAQELDIRIALENGRSLVHMEYIMQLCRALPAAGICVDTGHANLGDLGAARAIRMAGEKLITTHLHDNLGQVDDHLPPGEGQIDWAEVFHALHEVDYAGTLMLELTDGARHRPYDQDLEMRQGLENMRRLSHGRRRS